MITCEDCYYRQQTDYVRNGQYDGTEYTCLCPKRQDCYLAEDETCEFAEEGEQPEIEVRRI